MSNLHFGYAGKLSPNPVAVQQAAWLVKSDATPIGVERLSIYPQQSAYYRVVSNQDYALAAQSGRLIWTA